jgi:hypothetical protein
MLDHDISDALAKIAQSAEMLSVGIQAEADRLLGRLDKK